MEQGPSDEELWAMYMDGKQTMEELARAAGVSRSTINRRFKRIEKDWEQPSLSGGGFVHIDATYWGHNWGILLAIDDASSTVLYLSFIRHETVEDYRRAIASIEERGYAIRGIVFDGMQGLFKEFSRYNLQMCHFHMICIIRRYLTKNPRLRAARELKRIVFTITDTDGVAFEREFLGWKETFAATINRRSVSKRTGGSHYTHKRLRTAMHSVEFYLPYLFTFQREDCRGMPNTNNKIEGTFTDLKKNLNTHSGMSRENRKRFICGFFLTYTPFSWHLVKSNMSLRRSGHLLGSRSYMTCRHSPQSYSSQGCSPAEPRYASDCAAKVHNLSVPNKLSHQKSACNLTLRTKVVKNSLQNDPYASKLLYVRCDFLWLIQMWGKKNASTCRGVLACY